MKTYKSILRLITIAFALALFMPLQVKAYEVTDGGAAVYAGYDWPTSDHTHVKDDGTILQPSTCQINGIVSYHCRYCGKDMGQEFLPVLSHVRDAGRKVQDATCWQEGIVEYHCVNCGIDMGFDYTAKLNHVKDDGTITQEPTATTAGIKVYKCIYCGTVLSQEELPKLAKRDTPKAHFNTESLVLSNIPDDSSILINGGYVSTSISGDINLSGYFSQAGKYTIGIKANGVNGSFESDLQEIHIQKPKAPHGITISSIGNSGSLGAVGGVDTSMEYAHKDSDLWQTCPSGQIPVYEPMVLLIRYKATKTSIASDTVNANITRRDSNKAETPTASFDSDTMILSNIAGCRVSFDGGATFSGTLNDSSLRLTQTIVNPNRGIILYRPGDGVNTLDSDKQYLYLTKFDAPKGISTISATSSSFGYINGVNDSMEYASANDTAWNDIPQGANCIAVPAGTYYVRRQGIDNVLPSDIVSVTVSVQY